MKSILKTLVILTTFLYSCANTSGRPFRPIYQGVDSRVNYLVQEYLWLSKQNHITFYHDISLGLRRINEGDTVGLCNYGMNFREIDIDFDYWNTSSNIQRLLVTFHELTHCYCTRGHDWAEGRVYPPTEKLRVEEALTWIKNGGDAPGRLKDGCPSSIMYPIVVHTECALKHYNHYVSEMFNRCKPY